MKWVISIDFETTGSKPHLHGFIDFAAWATNLETGEQFGSFKVNPSRYGYTDEETTMTRFWLSDEDRKAVLTDTMEKCNNSSTDCHTAIGMFVDWVDRLRAKYGNDGYLITDSPIFDGKILDFFMTTPISYLFGEYKDVIDVGCFYAGVAQVTDFQDSTWYYACCDKLGIEPITFMEDAVAHTAIVDADLIARRWYQVQKHLNK